MQTIISLKDRLLKKENRILLYSATTHLDTSLFESGEIKYIKSFNKDHKQEVFSFNRLDHWVFVVIVKKERNLQLALDTFRTKGAQLTSLINQNKINEVAICNNGQKGKEVLAFAEGAKSAGVKMGIPVFEIEDIIKENSIHVFSTNYALYGDISNRVMNILTEMATDVEIYSIDEAFLDLTDIPPEKVTLFAETIKEKIQKWTGIPVSIGIGSTKTLAKLANHIAKTHPDHKGIFSFFETKNTEILQKITVDKIWGVGESYLTFFNKSNIFSALELSQADENRVREHIGIMGQRLVLELRGTACYGLNENPEHKNEICFARSFGHPLTDYTSMEEATVSYVSKIGAKLRKQKLLAGNLLIFIMTNKYAEGPKYVNYKIVKLPIPSNHTPELIHYAINALKKLFRQGYKYKKSGVIVSEVIPATGQQTGLWDNTDRPKNKKLIEAIDKINEKAGIEKVKYAVQGDEQKWKMRQEKLSPHFTTKWSDILIVDIDHVYRK